jgi:outer membrane protein OmpA-like peptidoglycan-associated protein
VVRGWHSYREIWFNSNDSAIQDSQATTLGEIAAYLKQNPSLQLGIDGSMNPRGSDPLDQGLRDLSARRVVAIRDSLIKAGVPADKIKSGTFGDPKLRQDRRAEVLISTGS